MWCSPSGTDCSSAGPPWHHWTCQEPPPAWASHKVPCSCVGSSTGCRCISAPPWMSMGCRVTDASPWSSSRAAGESLHWCLEHLLPLLYWLSVCRVVPFTYSPLFSGCNLLLPNNFFPFLKYIIPEVLPLLLLAWPWPEAGSSSNQ